MKIAVTGIGHVGLSISVLLAQHHEVWAVDIDSEKVALINDKRSPFKDKEIQEYLAHRDLNLTATSDYRRAYSDADYVIISTPTNYDSNTGGFDTSSVETVMGLAIMYAPNAVIVIRSTVPIGYTRSISSKLGCANVLFSPEFLREGRALYDNLHPSRIVIGVPQDNADLRKKAKEFADMLLDETQNKDAPQLFMGLEEAESVKLFANFYLAMRVSFFNEIDTFALVNQLSVNDIIDGICTDPRIGDYYNNPSFGYGGYCLPKDTKQLRSHYNDIPQKLISATIEANHVRKEFIADQIFSLSPDTVGVYRLTTKAGSDSFSFSSVRDVIKSLSSKAVKIIIYEPAMACDEFCGYSIMRELPAFKDAADIIIANRYDHELDDVIGKVFTRDLYLRD